MSSRNNNGDTTGFSDRQAWRSAGDQGLARARDSGGNWPASPFDLIYTAVGMQISFWSGRIGSGVDERSLPATDARRCLVRVTDACNYEYLPSNPGTDHLLTRIKLR